MAKRNILKQADETINAARPDKYGSVEESFVKIAAILDQIVTVDDIYVIMDEEGRPRSFVLSPELVAKVLIAMKLVRDSYSPQNPDHLLDLVGYAGLLDQLRQRYDLPEDVPEPEPDPRSYEDVFGFIGDDELVPEDVGAGECTDPQCWCHDLSEEFEETDEIPQCLCADCQTQSEESPFDACDPHCDCEQCDRDPSDLDPDF